MLYPGLQHDLVQFNHTCRLEIPEPALSLSWHRAPVGGDSIFLAIKITAIRYMYPILSEKINAHEMPHSTQILLMLFICV